MKIDKEIKKRIIQDHQKVDKDITKLFEGSTPNFYVRNYDYITPTIMGPELPLDDPTSYLQYLIKIRGCLESLLTEGKPPKGIPNPPYYLTKLLEE